MGKRLMGTVQRRLSGLVLWVIGRPRTTLAVAVAAMAVCVGAAWFNLGVSTDQNRLFSPDAPQFKAYLSFIERFPENEAAYVVVEARGAPPSVGRWVAVADGLTAALRAMPDRVRLVECRVTPRELGVYGFLFEEASKRDGTFADFVRFGDLLKVIGQKPGLDRLVLGRSPLERLMGTMAVAATARPGEFAQSAPLVALVAESAADALRRPEAPIGETLADFTSLDNATPRRLGYFYEPDASDPTRNLLLIRVYPKTNYTSLTALSEAVESIRETIRRVATGFPEFRVGLTGRPALEADEMRTTDTDAHRAEVVAMAVVFIGIAVMLRSVWLATVAAMALAVAIGWTFGWATVAVGELNLLSIVFVIALIGIGMDYLVQVLARYRREAKRYARPAAVWTRVFRYVSPPIFTACLGAAGAFLASALTDFRGAAELGIIAGGGLLLCLLAGYTVLPALLTLWPMKVAVLEAGERFKEERARAAGWRSWAGPAVWLGLLVAAIPLMDRGGFDPNLLTLQAPNLESVKLVRKLQTWSAVVMSKDLPTLRRARVALAGAGAVGSTDSLLDAEDRAAWLAEHRGELPEIAWATPEALGAGDLAGLAERARNLAGRYERAGDSAAARALRELAAAIAGGGADAARQDEGAGKAVAMRLNEWQAAWVGQLRELARQFTPPPLEVSKLPAELAGHYVADDGTYALYVHPAAGMDLWQAGPLGEFVEQVESRLKGVSGDYGVTGIAPNIHHTTGAIAKAFRDATLIALGLIALLVWIDLRSVGQTLLAISVLALGLPMLLAMMGLSGVKWNFANFFGLPILIGAGHEYGVFMIHRYRESIHSPRRVWRWWDPADRALLLCAFITSSSFGFFWLLGHHAGLRSLGWVMAVGTACIYGAAVAVLRPILRWRLRRLAAVKD